MIAACSRIAASIVIRKFSRLWRSLDEIIRMISLAPRPSCWQTSSRSNPFMFGISTTYDTPGRRSIRRSTSAASANCGSSFGFENEVTSSFLNPAATTRFSISTLWSVETTAGIDCSPSRAQHSHATIESGIGMARCPGARRPRTRRVSGPGAPAARARRRR